MTVWFRDDGGWAQVLIRLYEQDIYTGATNLPLTFDSNAILPSPNYQTQLDRRRRRLIQTDSGEPPGEP